MSLLALQRDFRASLLGAKEDAARRFGPPAENGLAVYHHAYRAQLIGVLRETFEHLRQWLGDDAFTECALDHIERVPPHGWTLGVYGEGFDTTLAALYPNDPEVRELAWLEWELSLAFSGKDAAPMTPEELAAVDWDNAALVFAPTLKIGRVTTNAGAIWSALAADEAPPGAEMLPEPAGLLVWRQDFAPCFRTIDDHERDALEHAIRGATFGELCAALVSDHGEEEGIGMAGALLGQWLHDGLVVGVRT